MRIGLVAEKLGMTQLFDDNGVQVPVTVLKVDPCTIVSLKVQDKDGYNAVQLGTRESSNGKHINRPQQGYFKKVSSKFFRILKEFRVDDVASYNVGDKFEVDHFSSGQLVDVTGITKGKGFAGGIKRHGFGGLRASHGVSITHRCHGSTGNRTLPGRVFKGKRMAGHMGDQRVTALNLMVHSVDKEKGVVFVRGAVPGGKKGTVFIRDAIKKHVDKTGK
ncbi:MAG: 50S ribosomal protein L3 [Holosporales bacterium]|jgi:large subunit ribosomal protein L3|nr:50S ribosomal protein L3 [Holosporales bacterium]